MFVSGYRSLIFSAEETLSIIDSSVRCQRSVKTSKPVWEVHSALVTKSFETTGLCESSIANGFFGRARTRDLAIRHDESARRAPCCKIGGTFLLPIACFDRTRVFVPTKVWWHQAEGLRALLRMAMLYPDDKANYLHRFEKLWAYIKKYVIDSRRGGWIWMGRDCAGFSKLPKADLWKDLSHEVDSVLYCMQLLKSGCPDFVSKGAPSSAKR